MKATLKLENIGQKEGKDTLTFNSGKLTLIKGRGATGKSRVIKSTALVLSFPILSRTLTDEAIKFGIMKDVKTEFSPLVNSNNDSAVIELNYDDISKRMDLSIDGEITIDHPGNEEFLYSSVIMRTSRIQENISRGYSDFSWIVNELSLAKDYETVFVIVDSYIQQIEKKKLEIEEIKTEKIEITRKIEDLNESRNELIKKIELLEQKISKIKKNPELKEKRLDIKKNIKTFQADLDENDKDKKKLEKGIKDIEGNINKNADRVEKNRLKIVSLTKEKEDLKEITVEKIQNEIIEIKDIIAQYREELGTHNNNPILKLKDLDIKDEITCPFCHTGKLIPEKVQNEKEEIEKKINEVKTKIKKENGEINKKKKRIDEKDKIPGIIKEIQVLEDESFQLMKSSDNFKNKIDGNSKKIKACIKAIDSDKDQLKKLNDNLAVIVESIKKDEEVQPLFVEKSEIDKNLGSVERQIKDSEEKMESSNIIKVFDVDVKIEKSSKVISTLNDVFTELKDHLESQISEQKGGAANKFNENIKNLIKELKFTEFKQVSIDLENYDLKVIRNDNTIQSINSLSGSERGIIASLLQICAKETYLPEIPFLVGDDILMDIDPVRREVFFDYLKKLAQKNDWFIILTQVTDEDLTITEL